MRVHELAKELNVSTQDIMKKLEGLGIFVYSGENYLIKEGYV